MEKGRLRTENSERIRGKTNFCQPKDFSHGEAFLCTMKSRLISLGATGYTQQVSPPEMRRQCRADVLAATGTLVPMCDGPRGHCWLILTCV